jgi:hypothetical protein
VGEYSINKVGESNIKVRRVTARFRKVKEIQPRRGE